MTGVPLKRILQIDDDEDILAVGQAALQGYGGFEVRTAQTGKEALEMAGSFAPQLILLDWMMPGMDGRAILHALQAAPGLAHVPVVYLTAAVENLTNTTYRYHGSGIDGPGLGASVTLEANY